MAQAEETRRRAEQDTQSQAMEIVSLRDRLAEAEESKGEARQKLGAAQEHVRHLEEVIARMEQDIDAARMEASEKRAEAQGLMGVAERYAQLTADLAAAQERAEAVEQALEERNAHAEAEQLLLHRVALSALLWPCRASRLWQSRRPLWASCRDQLTEVRASHTQLEQALAASTAESQATNEALRSFMACASSEALELAPRRCTQELATLNEELEEQTRMALAAQRAAESASAELAQGLQRQAAAEQQAAELEERFAAELAARQDTPQVTHRYEGGTAGRLGGYGAAGGSHPGGC
ncbi:g186 [Coccomyxa viridis]|uniref:G186 protein n=1 Tax=Coccomyxa viridis TaxID=1274662 RepID=A0ABP1FF39_9CHLO